MINTNDLIQQAENLMKTKDELTIKFRQMIPQLKEVEKQSGNTVNVDEIINKVNADDRFFNEKIKEYKEALNSHLK